MNLILSFLKYLGLFLIVCVVTVLGSSTVLSYYTAQKLHHIVKVEPESEPNLISILEISSRYMKDIREFEALMSSISKDDPMPAFCSTLCNPSEFEMDRYQEERLAYLKDYYQGLGAKALQDPQFRMRLKELTFVKKSMPPSIRSILSELYAGGKPSTALLALQLEGALLTEAPFIRSHYEQTMSDLGKLDHIRKIADSCDHIPNPESLAKECEAARLDAL